MTGYLRVGILMAATVVAGCTSSTTPDVRPGSAGSESPSTPATTDLPPSELSGFAMREEPRDARSVIESRKAAADGDELVIVGRIGGSENPFVGGRAMFTIADSSFKPCNETGDDSCPTPWDYCCTDVDELKQGIATVKFTDESGKTLPADAKQLLKLKELQTVVVKGKAKRDEAGNLTVIATGIYAR